MTEDEMFHITSKDSKGNRQNTRALYKLLFNVLDQDKSGELHYTN